MEKAGIQMRPSSEFSNVLAAPLASEIDELAERSESLEQRIASLNDAYEVLKRREVEFTEWRWVLREAGGFFDRVRYVLWCSSGPKVQQAYVQYRPIVILMRSVNPSTTTKRPCSGTLSSRFPEVKMVILRASSRSLS